MRRQRTLFHGRRPERTPRKDGENPLVPDRRLSALSPDEVEIRFNNRTATQFGGYPLLAGYLKDVGLSAHLARAIKMNRGPNAFTAPELGKYLVVAKMLGLERLMHLERFRHDPMLTHEMGIDGLPSGKTMGVFLKSFTEGHLASVDRMQSRILAQEWMALYGSEDEKDVVLDFDSTVTTAYGRQEGADRGRSFRKKDKPGFQPKFAFIGGAGLMVHQRLEPQSHNLDKDFFSFQAEAEARLPKNCRVWAIRADGALYSLEMVRRLEARGLVYSISAALTSHLRQAIHEIEESAWEEGVDEAGHRYSIARLRYCPKTWGEKGERERTYVISRRPKTDAAQRRMPHGDTYRYFAYVTNYRAPLVTQFRFGTERCSLESFIKEGKGSFQYNFLPCAERGANEAYLTFVQLAYNLAILFKLRTAPAGVNRWTMATLRRRVINICGNLRRRGSRWLLSLPAWWPYQTVFRQMQRKAALALGP